MRDVYRPKIQRLVTPLRLQRRRHLRSLKIRRLEHQKEQKAEYECVLTLFLLPKAHVWPFQCPYRKTHHRKEGESRCYQGVTQEVRLSLPEYFQRCKAHVSIPGLHRRRILPLGVCLTLYFLMQFRVVWCYILMPCHFYVSYFPDSILYE